MCVFQGISVSRDHFFEDLVSISLFEGEEVFVRVKKKEKNRVFKSFFFLSFFRLLDSPPAPPTSILIVPLGPRLVFMTSWRPFAAFMFIKSAAWEPIVSAWAFTCFTAAAILTSSSSSSSLLLFSSLLLCRCRRPASLSLSLSFFLFFVSGARIFLFKQMKSLP